ncbi:MAG: hypothetical protein KKE02_01675 [Alphaproteobacteria bacterium]|nr:hypothetical protein [Alphaproteobacteria bacterium]MBU1514949.1 hypothetical protein [Alphaproteobacteria bacterium]MBU2095614.1 hypothetical protein [Alphaproteobacteria bacterium]MBU2149700.1 hypothetical protein [Alphaproteobacteria bacterium]MBU2309075.1 hypothetical protein [Alphaproteobacteria bacterium]
MSQEPTRPLARGPLLAALPGAVVLAVLIVLGAILPAEFNRDPLGVGKLSGLSRLWAPDEKTVDPKAGGVARAREYDIPFRTDVVEIPLGDFMAGADKSELEYKVRMPRDATLTYSWEVVGTTEPRDFHFDQHGHTTPKPGEAMTVATYKQGYGLKQSGALTAPFDGIQGWQFSNSSEKPVVVKLRLAGFYTLIPSGQPGNEAGIVANVPAAEARP